MKAISLAVLTALLASAAVAQDSHHHQNTPDWNFAVSGDSRNCGDVVVPSIAVGAIKNKAAFYWHLGDLRAIYGADEDYQNNPEHRGKTVQKDEYLKNAWDDFIQNQLGAFGSMPVFIGIGNHETTPPKTREEFAAKFVPWLDSATLKNQRLADDPNATDPTTYFHWIQGGVDFIYLDNATFDQFSPKQVAWIEAVLERAAANPDVHALVVGMHAALPDSISFRHSMSDWPLGVESGRRVYADLLDLKKKTKKNVYLLASHSHFLMNGIFNSEYWAAHGGELPGWIVGTGGAVRYALPPDAGRAKEARTKVYGYLLGTVHHDGKIDFRFKEIKKPDTAPAVSQRYTPEFVSFCFDQNTNFNPEPAATHK